MNGHDLLRTFVQGVRADIAHCGAMLPLLTEQQRLLARHDSAELGLVAEQLNPHLQALEASAVTRAHALRGLGFKPSAQGVAALLAKLPAAMAQSLGELWRQLELALAQCHALNERNGELLAYQRTALAELTGKPLNHYGEPR